MTNAVPCLDPETIAAYLDRRLDPAERTRVEEHLADCEECRTLLSETAAFLEADAAAKPAPVALRPRAARRTWIWSMAAAAATLLALTPLVLQRMRPTPESALAELDRALAGKRYVESRLVGIRVRGVRFGDARAGDPSRRPAALRDRGRRQGRGAHGCLRHTREPGVSRRVPARDRARGQGRREPRGRRAHRAEERAHPERSRGRVPRAVPHGGLPGGSSEGSRSRGNGRRSRSPIARRCVQPGARPRGASASRRSAPRVGGLSRPRPIVGMGERSARAHRGAETPSAAPAALAIRDARRARVGRLPGLGSRRAYGAHQRSPRRARPRSIAGDRDPRSRRRSSRYRYDRSDRRRLARTCRFAGACTRPRWRRTKGIPRWPLRRRGQGLRGRVRPSPGKPQPIRGLGINAALDISFSDWRCCGLAQRAEAALTRVRRSQPDTTGKGKANARPSERARGTPHRITGPISAGAIAPP